MNKHFSKMTEKEIKEVVDVAILDILDYLRNVSKGLESNNVDKAGIFLIVQRINNAVYLNCNPAISESMLSCMELNISKKIEWD